VRRSRDSLRPGRSKRGVGVRNKRAPRHASPVRMCAVGIDACKEFGERGMIWRAPKPDFGSTEKE
jgi:hypothetical protein